MSDMDSVEGGNTTRDMYLVDLWWCSGTSKRKRQKALKHRAWFQAYVLPRLRELTVKGGYNAVVVYNKETKETRFRM